MYTLFTTEVKRDGGHLKSLQAVSHVTCTELVFQTRHKSWSVDTQSKSEGTVNKC